MGVKYTKVEDIDRRMKELTKRQMEVSMSLNEEKKLIKEMEELSASKKVVGLLASKEGEIGASKLGMKEITAAIAEKNAALKTLSTEMDERKKEMDALSAKDSDTRGKIPDLIKERDGISKKRNDVRAEIKKLRDEFKRENNEWYQYKKLSQARKKAEYEAERKKRDEEKQAWLKAKEEEVRGLKSAWGPDRGRGEWDGRRHAAPPPLPPPQSGDQKQDLSPPI